MKNKMKLQLRNCKLNCMCVCVCAHESVALFDLYFVSNVIITYKYCLNVIPTQKVQHFQHTFNLISSDPLSRVQLPWTEI